MSKWLACENTLAASQVSAIVLSRGNCSITSQRLPRGLLCKTVDGSRSLDLVVADSANSTAVGRSGLHVHEEVQLPVPPCMRLREKSKTMTRRNQPCLSMEEAFKLSADLLVISLRILLASG